VCLWHRNCNIAAHMNVVHPRAVWMTANVAVITANVEWKSYRSSSNITQELALSPSRVLKTLHGVQYYSYHYLRGAHLFPDYHLLWIQICKWVHRHTVDEFFLHKIITQNLYDPGTHSMMKYQHFFWSFCWENRKVWPSQSTAQWRCGGHRHQ
jgi:hypothetical protein